MRKIIFAAIAAGASIANAGVTVSPAIATTEPQFHQVSNPVPPIIGYIKNRAGGQIVLATEKCSTEPDLQFAFVKDDGGKLSLTGCWRMIGEDIIIKWSDNDVFSYPVDSIEFTDSFNQWSERNEREKSRNRNL
jgi:hypothetical protein